MITPGKIAPGQPIRLTTAFTDAVTELPIDPTTLEFDVKKPCGSKTTYTYGTDTELVKDSTGNYHIDVTPDIPGRWFFRWVSTGTGAGATEGFFNVQKSRFVDTDCYRDYC